MGTYVPPLPVQNFQPKKSVVTSAWLNQIDAMLQGNIPAAGIYDPTFQSGQVQLTGPNGYVTAYGDFGFSLLSPGPGGTGPFLRVAGAGKTFGQIGTDAQVPGQHGINLYISAGDSDPSGTTAGGTLLLFGGASLGGVGGNIDIQAGSSVNGPGGDLFLGGGNNTAGNNSAGNVFIVAGTEGSVGGSIKIYATKLNGVAGAISFWLGQPDVPHSVPLWTMSATGALFPGNSGAGSAADTVNCIPPSVLVTGGNLAQPNWTLPGLNGQFNLALSGATTTTPVQAFTYQTDGRIVFLSLSSNDLTATPSGPNDIILSTLPVGLRPSIPRIVPCIALVNGGATNFAGQAFIDTLGGITISVMNSVSQIAPGQWSLGGAKGLSFGWSICYGL